MNQKKGPANADPLDLKRAEFTVYLLILLPHLFLKLHRQP